ncbi:response regulator transcription factor [Lentzea sp. NPDC059081]|uniref:helix-turn-helix transcriptional regulator n=1 Tax=Lentzea sp. NPDC059081 TaxID=3346719 RepID=UPI0036D13070
MNVTKVLVQASDPLADVAISNYLGASPNTEVVPDESRDAADAIVLATERVTVKVLSLLRSMKDTVAAPVVLIINEIGDSDLFVLVECNVMAVLPRATTTGDRVVEAVLAAVRGGGVMPPKMLGELIRHVDRIQREVLSAHGLHASGLTPREIEVLRMMSDGLNTKEIATELFLSERAVKRVVFGLTTRLNLRNRPHAVAYALRMGLI